MIRLFVAIFFVSFFVSCGTAPAESAETEVPTGVAVKKNAETDMGSLVALYRDAEVRLLRRPPGEVRQIFSDLGRELYLTCWDWDATEYYREPERSPKINAQLAPGADPAEMRFLTISLNRGSDRYEGEEFVGYFLFYQDQLVSACVYRVANPELDRSLRNLVQEAAAPLIGLTKAPWADAAERLQDANDPFLCTDSAPDGDGNAAAYLLVPAPQGMPRFVTRSGLFPEIPSRFLSRWVLKIGSFEQIPLVIGSPAWSFFNWNALLD